MMSEKDCLSRILVVDDDFSMRRLCSEALSGAGYTVDVASNGLEALEMLAAEGYDLVLSDVEMPGLDGLGLYERVCSDHRDLSSSFIFMTGSSRREALETLSRMNIQYLQKPFAITELIKHVEMAEAERVQGTNKRREKRVGWQGDCFFTEVGSRVPIFSRSVDISRNGIRLRYEGDPVETEDDIRVYLALLKMDVKARLVWSKPIREGESVSGLEFTEPLPAYSVSLLERGAV